ncbi:zinc finger matrin-type protein CG9776 isoform X1 [Zeugodacus cucurbitae]|uniref:Zinc finger matrin-type protein CG9776 n=2 Tax=Zeugodacus cucurbitae TaxID=28588 RepID=A0A0A1WMQ9_ZEUCU|nr:zinc finger matrin-type protein CG9776 isoform X1 [Zeugodacus cucurbitae]
MDEELILQQPADRRLGTGNTLPPGPPGAENDVVDYETNKPKIEKESNRSSTSRSSRRRSPSGSPPRSRRKSPSRGRRSPSPLDGGSRRRRRSPSPPPRRNRFRDYSPDRRRFDGGGRNIRRSPDRRRGGGRDFRYRGRSNSRSRSRSVSPRRGGGSRWSPKKKPSSPLPINAPPPPQVSQPQTQYNAMPPQLYANDTYAPTAYNQYAVPPPQQAGGFPPQTAADAYGMQAPAPPVFNTAYPPPPVWTANDAYAQQPWIPTPDPSQLPQIAQQPPPVAAPTTIPPPQIVQQPTVIETAPVAIESSSKHDAAVAQEAENQRDELKRQRSSYLKKTSLLRKELKMLKDQRKDLHSGGAAPPSPTTKGFIDENEKLQNQIQKKLNTIENVIDMLTGIIGEENLERDDELYGSDKSEKEEPAAKKHAKEPTLSLQPASVGANNERSRKKKRKNSSTSSTSSTGSSSSSTSTSSSSSSSENEVEEEDDDSSPERLKNKAMESMKAKAKEGVKRELKEEKLFDEKKRFNYVFYDPEMHWCQTCDVFPKTAKDYLNHLHSKEHMDRECIETPWHTDAATDQFPNYENAPTKRTPIRGLTFFVPASAWFCKLCNNWMGDLHCASTHLKSQIHASKYNAFLEKNPHFEVNWLADRQRVLNERKTLPPPQQITSVSTTAAESTPNKKSKKEEKVKKRKKKGSDKKDKKKKRKRSKKRKKNAATTSTSSDSSSSDSEKPNKTKSKSPIVIQGLDNPNPALSIRVAMRKQDLGKAEDDTPPPPAPRLRIDTAPHPVPPPTVTVANSSTADKVDPAALLANSGRLSKWTEAQDNSAKVAAGAPQRTGAQDDKNDDTILQQWNNVQPVISESEKKLLEQLKGKLKNKPHESATTPAGASIRSNNDGNSDRRVRDRDRDRERERDRERDRDRDRDRDRNDRDRSDRRRRSRSPVFGGGGGRGRMRRTRSRTRSRSRGRAASPYGRRRRTRSRSRGRRSRSFERRRRYSRSRTRSRTRSSSRSRIEKPIVRHPEFRPRVPEKDKEREKRSTTEMKDKKNADKKSKSISTSSTATSGKKLPFIGKMPVFKKQTAGQADGNGAENTMTYAGDNSQHANPTAYVPQRPPAPTAAQIQMAMMEDVYGNAPPFHPDAGMMMDYEELMPDPIQFVNLMGQAPPPPPPPAADGGAKSTNATDDEAEDILPPGIDVAESDDCVPRPISDGPLPRKGPLPKDLEEALNIIFPGEKKSDDEDADDVKKAKSTGETQIITEEPIMQPEDLVKEGIHMVTIEETSMVGMDEASQMSMNEPLVFNKPASSMPTEVVTTNANNITTNVPQIVDITSQDAADIDLNAIQPPPPPTTTAATAAADVPAGSELPASTAAAFNGVANTPAVEESSSDSKNSTEEPDLAPVPDDIPMPTSKTSIEDVANIVYDLDDIPQPPPSPTESEKNRRQEELNDLAMLGIDADDMAAQCI